MTRIEPYGSWTSPLSAADLARGEHPVQGGTFVGDEVWWSELRSEEQGRYAVRRHNELGQPVDLLPVPWNARTRVHEYGGGAWVATPDGAIIFSEFSDSRLYRLDRGATDPVALTPAPSIPAGLRYGELQLSADGTEVWSVRETHVVADTPAAAVTRDLAAIPLDGSAAEDNSKIRSIVAGSHFLAAARVSPDGSQLAWIAWEHPQMPWDGTELRVGPIGADGTVHEWRTIIGSTTESVLQPEWIDSGHLYVISDRTGWWNLYRIDLTEATPEPRPLHAASAEFGAPLWQLGARWYQILPDGQLLTVRTLGLDTLARLDPRTGELTDIATGDLTTLRLGPVQDGVVLLTGGGARSAAGLRRLDLNTQQIQDVRLSVDALPDERYLPPSYAATFVSKDPATNGREVHAFVYPPSNPDFTAPTDELPPFVAFVHGGPTAHVTGLLNHSAAYFTSHGIGVVDVNYGGSTGYGREYRERLRGQWGIVDVEDVVTAVQGLADSGQADGARLAIRGGSAGGWTVLAALTETDAFACGASYFGVAELIQFAAETHDFESRYLDGLIGPLPEARELYERRAPVNNVDGLSCPVLLLQGLDDPIVPPSQAERFRDALVAKNMTYAYLTYEGESHGFRKTETIINATESELSFYGQVMGFVPVDVPVLPLENTDQLA